MTGWYPRFNPSGSHLAAGSGTLELDGVALGPGWQPCWPDEAHILVFEDGTAPLLLYALDGTSQPASPPAGVNAITAGGGRFAYWAGSRQTVVRDTGEECYPGHCPAVWGDHLAYLGSLTTDAIKRLVVDGREVGLGDFVRVQANQGAVVWLAYAGGMGFQVWGMAWTGTPTLITPGWHGCLEARPVEGPDGPYLLAVEQLDPDTCRLVLVAWGSHEGYVLGAGDIRNADANWGADGIWRFAWGNGQGILTTVTGLADAPFVDLLADQPPPVVPTIAFRLDGLTGTITERVEIATTRWRLDNFNAPVPNSWDTYDYSTATPGPHMADVLAQTTAGDIIFAGPQPFSVPEPPAPPEPGFRDGFDGVVTGFGEPRGDALYAELKARGWTMARVCAARRFGDDNAGITQEIVAEVLRANLRPYVTCWTKADVALMPEWIDLGWQNEPEMGTDAPKLTPQQYVADLIGPDGLLASCAAHHQRLWLGEIGNPDAANLRWLDQMLALLPPGQRVTVHRYADKHNRPASPRPKYDNREQEMAAFGTVLRRHAVVGYLVGEFSYPQDPFRSCFRLVPGWTNLEVAQFIAFEDAFWRQHWPDLPCEGWCWFQIGEGDKGRSGLRTKDGQWKEPQSRLPDSA